MMGRRTYDQEQFFYSFRIDEAVPDDHPVREIAAVLDLSWVHSELAPYYPRLGRPSIDPVLMIRMLIVGYVFAIRSERALCRDVRMKLAYRQIARCSLLSNWHPPARARSSRRYLRTHIRRLRTTRRFGCDGPENAQTIPARSDPHRTARTGLRMLYSQTGSSTHVLA
jgi:hypothetical protein